MALHPYQKEMYKKIGIVAALIILPIAGFFAGMQYQKQTAGTTATNARGAFGGQFTRGAMRGRTLGTVKAISSSSITITTRLDNSDKTYTLTSSTVYKNGASAAQNSDVKVGDTVMLTLDPSDTTKVTTVTINPTTMFRGSTDDAPTTSDNSGNATLQ